MGINEPYEKLFGFVPELTKIRHKFTSEVYPEILDIHEEFRKRCINSDALDEKVAQLVLFALLSSHMREGAKVHAIASRKLGVSWKELHAVSNLVFLFSGLSAMNFSIRLLAEIKDQEEKNRD